MAPEPSELQQLKAFCEGVALLQDGGKTLYYLTNLALPNGCQPGKADALLCDFERDGYESRLYFAKPIACPVERNWNFDGVVAGQRWYAISWKVSPRGRTPRQLLASHLEALQC